MKETENKRQRWKGERKQDDERQENEPNGKQRL